MTHALSSKLLSPKDSHEGGHREADDARRPSADRRKRNIPGSPLSTLFEIGTRASLPTYF